MRICFLANFGKTIFYDGIARALLARGHEIVWMTPSSRWDDHLAASGVSRDAILDFSASHDEWKDAPVLDAAREGHLAALERRVDLSVNDIIAMDRAVRHLPSAKGRAYLAMVERQSRSFLERTRPDMVLGEATWAWEVMAGAVARDLGIAQYCFSSVRFPSERIAFSDGYRDERLFPVRPADDKDMAEAARLVDSFRARPTKPLYEVSNSALPTFRPHWLDEARVLMFGAERGNPQARSLGARVVSRGVMLMNLTGQQLRPPFEPVPPEPRKAFVLCLLHVQPESTIDAYGSAHADQIDNIAMLARILPVTHEIYVKEHPSAAGDRGPAYYKRLKRIPGVRLIPPRADTFTLMREAWLVVSVAGSACYEAGLLGAPAATMAPLFFSELMITRNLTPKAESVVSLAAMVDAHCAVPDAVKRAGAISLVAEVLRSSFPATVSDPASNPACMAIDNLERLADGIEAVHRYGR